MSLVPPANLVIDDRVVVRFNAGVARAVLEGQIVGSGYSVIDADCPSNYYVLKMPSGIALQNALQSRDAQPYVAVSLPDNEISHEQSISCDGTSERSCWFGHYY